MNVRYLSHFTGSAATLIFFNTKKFRDRPPLFITDGRYNLQANRQTSGFDILITDTWMTGITAICKEEKISKMAFESHHLTHANFLELSSKTETEFIPIRENLSEIRRIKDRSEISEIRKSIAIATRSFHDIKHLLREGVTEREIKTELQYAFAKNGALKPSFDAIVAFGRNSALPHAIAGDEKLSQEALVLIDFGVFSGIYASDETITLYYGKNPSSEIRKIYDLVKKAHNEAILQIKPGMKASDVDKVARGIIDQGGYGKFFNHSLGHSVGIETHDGSRLSTESKEIIEEGMVLTIEPGIYLEKIGGVRLEDMVLITSSGAEVLTELPKDLDANMIFP